MSKTISDILNNNQISFLEENNLNVLLLLEAELHQGDDEDIDKVTEEESPEEGEEQAPEEGEEDGEEQAPPEPTEEEQFAFELEGTQDKFIQFVLYEKILDLSNKISILKDNIQSGLNKNDDGFLSTLKNYEQYIQVLNELIFTVSTGTIYKLLGQLELELIELLEKYVESVKKKQLLDAANEAEEKETN
jgi:hypothetical protein